MITGIERESAKNFPASKTLPPPMAMIESQSFLSIRFLILSRSSKQQSNFRLDERIERFSSCKSL